MLNASDTVIDEYVTQWQVDDTVSKQTPIQLTYAADLTSGWKLRISYDSKGSVDVIVKINYFLQKDF